MNSLNLSQNEILLRPIYGGIIFKIFSNEKSLLTDRKKYTDCFYYFYDYVQTHQFTEETAIASLS